VAELHEKDSMVCRACGREERASEGYPCTECGTYFRGTEQCKKCASAGDHAT